MQEIVIRNSPKKIVKSYAKYLLYSIPLLLAILGLELEKNYHPSKKLLPYLIFVTLLFYGILITITAIKIYNSSKNPIIKLNENGLSILNSSLFGWSSIYDFKIIYKNRKTFNNRARVYEITKLKYLQINDQEFDITEQYSSFEVEDLVEIIKRYKDELELEIQRQSVPKIE